MHLPEAFRYLRGSAISSVPATKLGAGQVAVLLPCFTQSRLAHAVVTFLAI